MNLRDFAVHYARWVTGDVLADNAPTEIRQLLGDLSRRTSPTLVAAAIRQLAGQAGPESPAVPAILAFFAAYPGAADSLESVLRSKKPPQSFQELAERAYQDHYQLILKEVRAWMMARLTDSSP